LTIRGTLPPERRGGAAADYREAPRPSDPVTAIRSFHRSADDEAPENSDRQLTTEYPRRKPNPIMHLIRWLWALFVIALIVTGIIALYQMLDVAWWYEVPILLVFGYCTYVLFRNRRRRQRAL
jgi:Flp pilus assembly protein TadB